MEKIIIAVIFWTPTICQAPCPVLWYMINPQCLISRFKDEEMSLDELGFLLSQVPCKLGIIIIRKCNAENTGSERISNTPLRPWRGWRSWSPDPGPLIPKLRPLNTAQGDVLAKKLAFPGLITARNQTLVSWHGHFICLPFQFPWNCILS